MYKPIVTVSLLALTALGWMQDRRKPAVSLGDCEMILEWNPGQEAVVRITAESEKALESIRIFRPDGLKLVDLDARNRVQSGISGLNLELREPDLERLLENYAEGSYQIRAATVGGDLARGNAQLSFDLPSVPLIVHPRSGAIVQASNLTVFWLAGRDTAGYHDAAGYEVQLEQGDNDGLRVRLPPEQSSFQVPPGFLAPGTETSLEIAAIGANGNRTVVDVLFTTQP